jgi:hypothetical membrane protein
MEAGLLFCVSFIVTGVCLLVAVIVSLAKHKLTETFSVVWAIFAVLLILAGAAIQPTELARYISTRGMLLLLFIAYSILVGAYFLSTSISRLIRRNQELAMQVSLLNNENARIMQQITEIEEKLKMG